jgi:hypothetical protein
MQYRLRHGIGFVVMIILTMVSCAGTRLTNSQVDDSFRGKPVSDILVIVVTDKEPIRQSFERHFVARLQAAGLEAISSIDISPDAASQKLSKAVILEAVKAQKNDAVIITHLAAYESKEVFSRGLTPYNYDDTRYGEFYGHYGFIFDHVHEPTLTGDRTVVSLTTDLYDVATEERIWSGRSETMDPAPTNDRIGEVVDLVVKELGRLQLIAPK